MIPYCPPASTITSARKGSAPTRCSRPDRLHRLPEHRLPARVRDASQPRRWFRGPPLTRTGASRTPRRPRATRRCPARGNPGGQDRLSRSLRQRSRPGRRKRHRPGGTQVARPHARIDAASRRRRAQRRLGAHRRRPPPGRPVPGCLHRRGCSASSTAPLLTTRTSNFDGSPRPSVGPHQRNAGLDLTTDTDAWAEEAQCHLAAAISGAERPGPVRRVNC
jgi:hypothetical protein